MANTINIIRVLCSYLPKFLLISLVCMIIIIMTRQCSDAQLYMAKLEYAIVTIVVALAITTAVIQYPLVHGFVFTENGDHVMEIP